MGVEGYIRRFDELCRSVALGEQRLETIERDHVRRLADIEKKHRVKSQDLITQKNDAILQAKRDWQCRDQEISNYIRQIDDYDGRIPERLRKGAVVDESALEPKDCDWNALDAMAMRILDDTLWGKVKGVLNVDGYYSRKDMVRDYLARLKGARKFAEQESRVAWEQERAAEQNAASRMRAGCQTADSARSRETQQENASFSKKRQQEQNAIARLTASAQLKPVADSIRKDFDLLMGDASALGAIRLPQHERDDILIGTLHYELSCKQSHQRAIEEGLRQLCRFPLVKLPCMVSTHGSYLMLVEVLPPHRGKAFDGIRSIMARSIVSYPFEGLEITYLDPIDRGTNLERFGKLSTSDDCTAFRMPAASEDDIEREMIRLEKEVDSLSLKLATVGTVDDYNAGKGTRLPHRLIVINDFPAGFNRKALDAMGVLLNNREKCGLSFIVTHHKGQKPEREATSLYERIEKEALRVEEASKGFLIRQGSRSYRFSFMQAKGIPDEFFEGIEGQYSSGKRVDNSFARVCDFKRRLDFSDSTNGLYIPFAVNRGNEVVELELGTSAAAHMVITGSTGSGKSTTLHAIIAGIMLKYHPDDVQIWLIDYKLTEFAEYLRNVFPHITLIGLDKSKEFTLALVDMIYAEKERRDKLFSSAHVQDVAAYKKDYGVRSLPRIVIVFDEFHNLAQTIKDDPVYVTKFENILSECRSVGMSCIISDQSIIEGLRGLTEKGKKQLTSRIAMRNSYDEVRGTLDLDPSLYTDELKGRIRTLTKGDVVMKRETLTSHGYDASVEVDKFKSIYVKREDRQNLVAYIEANTKDCTPVKPLVVNGQKRLKFSKAVIQEYEKTAEAPRAGETYLYLGTPSNFEPCFRILLTKQLGQNIAVLGQEADRRVSVILYAVRSFTRSKDARAIICAHPEDPLYEHYAGLFVKISSSRISVVDDMLGVCNAVSELSGKIDAGEKQNTLLVLLGYELLCDEFELLPGKPAGKAKQRSEKPASSAMSGIDEMLSKFNLGVDNEEQQASEDGEDAAEDKGYDARDDVGTIVAKGCRYGIHVMLSLEKCRVLRKAKTFKLDSFDHRIALPISPDESLDFFGTSQAVKGLDEISAAYSDAGAPPKVFRPYLVPGPKIRGRETS